MASRAKRKRLARDMNGADDGQRKAAAAPTEASVAVAVSAQGGAIVAPVDGLFYRDLYVGGVDKASGRKVVDYAERRVDVIASTETVDSHNEIVEQSWILDRYLRNPVVLWNHNSLFQADKKPIGRAENVRVENPGTPQAALKMSIIFASAEANPEAERILRLFDEGIQRAVSVGFRPTEIRQERKDDRDLTILAQNVLYELSATPIPSNPDALAEQRSFERRFIREHVVEPIPADPLAGVIVPRDAEERGAVAYSGYKPVTGKWDAGAAKKRIKAWATSGGKTSMPKYRRAFAWYDAANAESMGAYKLPHHDIRGGEMVTVKAGVVAAGNAMQGARGGVRIPAGDKAAVKAHLAKHYKQFGMAPPWAKSDETCIMTLDDKGLRIELTPPAESERGGHNPNMENAMDYEEIQAALTKAQDHVSRLTDEVTEERARGDVLEAQNAKLVEERDQATAELKELKLAAVRAEVEALVGVKFAPTEVEDQVKLALENRELFDKLTEQRSTMTLLEKDPAGMGAPPKAKRAGTNDKGEGFAQLVNAAATARAAG